MLKKLLNAFSKKKSPPPPADAELITVFDSYGRELKITRREWRDSVLLPNLDKAWNAPEELYSFLISALDDGFVDELNEASLRLLEIDDNPERSHTIRSIALMKTGRLDEAGEVLQRCVERVGETGILLTNLAKVYDEQGDADKTASTLRRALALDPNQENGLGWWAAIRRENDGEQGYLSALREAAAIPGSWRPQLWLAREHLHGDDVAAATALYQSVLGAGGFDSEALLMISGDLGQSGHVHLIPQLVAPAYQVARHDPRAGMNLLQAYLELGLRGDGERLLEQLYALDLAPYRQHLDHYAAQFQQIEQQASRPQAIPDPSSLTVETIAIDQPIWRYGLRDPDWFFAAKPADAPRITFFSFSKRAADTDGAEVQREDGIGRMSRAIALYLAESARAWTAMQAETLIPIIAGGGPVLFGADHDDVEIVAKYGAHSRYFVTGEIGGDERQWRIACRLWDGERRQQLAEEIIDTAPDDIGAAVLELEQRLLARIGPTQAAPDDAFYTRPSKEQASAYLVELGQSLMLTLLANGKMSTEGMWGERNMLEWPLRMALEWPRSEVAKLMYISGLAKAAQYHSSVVPEFKSRTLEFIQDAGRDGSPVARFAPLVWSIFGMRDELAAHQAAPGGDASERYRAWLSRLDAETA